ncbi:hypothetical protein C8Q76DRAFT_789382 [Earliella scabrosa]|nr:hypothetical protein C8Q76DRAFT_789382 [Earliella scabrosa]
MAPGLQTTLAFTLVRNFPVVIPDIATSIDNEIDRDKFILPSDLTRWATIMTSRSMCRFAVFSTGAAHEIERYRSMLKEQYPGDGELLDRLNAAVTEMSDRLDESNQVWEQFRMHYDNSFLHLPDAAAREAMEKSYAEFERTLPQLIGRSAGTTAIVHEWQPCFQLVLTEAGRQAYTKSLEDRRTWMTETFPGQVTEMVQVLEELRVARVQLLADCAALWDEILQAWFTRSGDRLPTHIFLDAMRRYVKMLDDLDVQGAKQRDILNRLKSCMRLVEHHTTTLDLLSAEQISIADVRESFHQYDTNFMHCVHTTELCIRLKNDITKCIATLTKAREQI